MNAAKMQAWAEKQVDALCARLTARWEKELRAELAKWEARFPRHKFKAAQAHGLLIVRVSPPILGENDVENVYELRGAIAELRAMVEAVKTAHANLEWRTGTHESDWIIP